MKVLVSTSKVKVPNPNKEVKASAVRGNPAQVKFSIKGTKDAILISQKAPKFTIVDGGNQERPKTITSLASRIEKLFGMKLNKTDAKKIVEFTKGNISNRDLVSAFGSKKFVNKEDKEKAKLAETINKAGLPTRKGKGVVITQSMLDGLFSQSVNLTTAALNALIKAAKAANAGKKPTPVQMKLLGGIRAPKTSRFYAVRQLLRESAKGTVAKKTAKKTTSSKAAPKKRSVTTAAPRDVDSSTTRAIMQGDNVWINNKSYDVGSMSSKIAPNDAVKIGNYLIQLLNKGSMDKKLVDTAMSSFTSGKVAPLTAKKLLGAIGTSGVRPVPKRLVEIIREAAGVPANAKPMKPDTVKLFEAGIKEMGWEDDIKVRVRGILVELYNIVDTGTPILTYNPTTEKMDNSVVLPLKGKSRKDALKVIVDELEMLV